MVAAARDARDAAVRAPDPIDVSIFVFVPIAMRFRLELVLFDGEKRNLMSATNFHGIIRPSNLLNSLLDVLQ